MKSKNLQFKIGMPISKKNYGLNEDGTLTIKGIASTTNKDLHDEIISPQAIESLKEQVVNRNLHLDHNHDYMGGIGVIDDAFVEDNQLYIIATILPEFAESIKSRLDLGMNFGLSIAGVPIRSRTNPQLIEDYNLLEVSLTLLPANWDTYGTVESKGFVMGSCLTGVCNYILKKENGENMNKKELINEDELQKLVEETVAEVVQEKEEEVAEEEVVEEVEEKAEDEFCQKELPDELTLEDVIQLIDDKINQAFAEKEKSFKEVITRDVKEALGGEYKDEINAYVKELVAGEEEEKSGIVVEENPEGIVEEPVPDVEELVEKSISRILKKIDQKESKFLQATKNMETQNKKSFLGNGNRDQFGRNKNYL